MRSRAEAQQALAVLDAQLAEVLPPAELEALVGVTSGLLDAASAASGAGEAPAISPVTGRPVSGARAIVTAQRNDLLRGFALRRQLLAGALEAEQVAELLGTTGPELAGSRVAAGTLVAISDDGRLRYPIWQFDPEGPDGALEGLPQVLAELPRLSQLGRIAWFVSPKRGLDGRTPAEVLREGGLDAVLGEARGVAAS